jgi:hypothetical protein
VSDAALRARIGAFAQHAAHDVRKTTAAGRAAFLGRFERQVDPDGLLEPAERTRRAQSALRAHMARLALRSAQAREARARRRGQDQADGDPA